MFPSVYGVVSQQSKANWWEAGGAPTPVAVYQPIGAASLAASYVNLANPGTYDAAPGVAPTWASATGWTFSAAIRTRLLTGVVPDVGTWSVFILFSDAVAGGPALGFNVSATCRLNIYPGLSTTRYYRNGGNFSTSGVIESGVMAVAGQSAYLNGSLDGALSGAQSGTPIQIWIGGYNPDAATTTGACFTGNIQAVAIYSSTLDASQVAAVSAAMAAL